jgi:hypothetical protein
LPAFKPGLSNSRMAVLNAFRVTISSHQAPLFINNITWSKYYKEKDTVASMKITI